MHVHYNCDHEVNLGGDCSELDNIETMFNWCVVLFPKKLILKYKKVNQDLIFFSQELFLTLMMYKILFNSEMILHDSQKNMAKIAVVAPLLRALITSWDLNLQIDNPFIGMLIRVLGDYV